MSISLTVKDLMDRQFLTFPEEMSVLDAVEILQTRKLFGGCVVDSASRVLGILSEKACIQLYEKAISGTLGKDLKTVKVTECMYPDFNTIAESVGIVQAAEIFIKSEFRRLPVVEAGRLVGQITRRDIVKAVHQIGHE